MFKKFILSLALCSFIFASIVFPFARSVQAQETETWYSQTFLNWSAKVFDFDNQDEIFGERYTAAQVQWIYYSFIGHIIISLIGQENFTCLIDHGSLSSVECLPGIIRFFANEDNGGMVPQQSRLAQQPQTPSLLGFINGYIESNSLSGVGYVVKSIRKINPHIIPQANAQTTGFGYNVFPNNSIFRQLWSTVRDISYFFVVLAVVYISFMIMFRSKISPQAAITVQVALPKIVIALVLITFSYAIAGFMIDIMYVLIGVVALIVTSSGVVTNGWTTVFNFLTSGPYEMGMFGYFFYYGVIFFITTISVIFQLMLSPSLPAFIISWMAVLLMPIILLILTVVYFLAFIKSLVAIVKTYVNVILSIIGAPLILAAGLAFPSVGLGTWLTGLMSNLLVFPVISIMAILAVVLALAAGGILSAAATNLFDLANILVSIFTGSDQWAPIWNMGYFIGDNNLGWVPPLSTGNAQLGNNVNYLGPLLLLIASLSVLLMIPKAAEFVKSLVSRKPFAYGSAIGEGLAPFATAGLAGWELARNFGTDQLSGIGTYLKARYPVLQGVDWVGRADRWANRVDRGGSPNVPPGPKTQSSGKRAADN